VCVCVGGCGLFSKVLAWGGFQGRVCVCVFLHPELRPVSTEQLCLCYLLLTTPNRYVPSLSLFSLFQNVVSIFKLNSFNFGVCLQCYSNYVT